MPRPRSAMRKIREVLRLSQGEGLSRRQVARAAGVPPTTVADYLGRIAAAGLSWPLPDGMDDADLERRLFTRGDFPPQSQRPSSFSPSRQRRNPTPIRRPPVNAAVFITENIGPSNVSMAGASHGPSGPRDIRYRATVPTEKIR